MGVGLFYGCRDPGLFSGFHHHRQRLDRSTARCWPDTGRGYASDVKNVEDVVVIGLDEALADLDYFAIWLHGQLTNIFENSAERIARKATSALKKGKFKAFKSGRLSASHYVVEVENKLLEIVHYRVENRSEYAIYIHNGTKRIRKRPWLRSVTIEEEDKIIRRIADAFAAYKGGSGQGIGVTSIDRMRTVHFNQGKRSGRLSSSVPGVSFSSSQ